MKTKFLFAALLCASTISQASTLAPKLIHIYQERPAKNGKMIPTAIDAGLV